MNKPEYNRKIKALDQDMERLTAEMETRMDKIRWVHIKRAVLYKEGWTE